VWNVRLQPRRPLSPFRRIAFGTWRDARDPQVYGALALDVGPALDYVERLRAATGEHVTLTHLMVRVIGELLHRVPEANAIVRPGGVDLRREVAVFLQVAMRDETTGRIDLSGVKIAAPHTKGVVDICREMQAKVDRARRGKDEEIARNKQLFARIPAAWMGRVLGAAEFVQYTLNLDLRRLGLPRDAFGGAMITNVGSLGLEEAYPPLVPFSRVPLIVAMGAVHEAPLARDGSLVIARCMKLCATFDHRALDGAHAAQMATIVRAWFAAPDQHFGAVPT
jgi:pyruvate dehydrogenase E2 component (dihydrolipoamide acetyltransferase)